jgi:hypothetical protein
MYKTLTDLKPGRTSGPHAASHNIHGDAEAADVDICRPRKIGEIEL